MAALTALARIYGHPTGKSRIDHTVLTTKTVLKSGLTPFVVPTSIAAKKSYERELDKYQRIRFFGKSIVS